MDPGAMYTQQATEQFCPEASFLPFGGKLRKDSRWVKLSGIWNILTKVTPLPCAPGTEPQRRPEAQDRRYRKLEENGKPKSPRLS